jgi:hypothetical protein
VGAGFPTGKDIVAGSGAKGVKAVTLDLPVSRQTQAKLSNRYAVERELRLWRYGLGEVIPDRGGIVPARRQIGEPSTNHPIVMNITVAEAHSC